MNTAEIAKLLIRKFDRSYWSIEQSCELAEQCATECRSLARKAEGIRTIELSVEYWDEVIEEIQRIRGDY